jgi:hypothetical protein
MFRPEADEVLDELERDPATLRVLEAIERTLDRLADDPYDPRLGSTAFQTEELGNVSATPARVDDWYVFWHRGPEPRVLDVVLIQQLSTD